MQQIIGKAFAVLSVCLATASPLMAQSHGSVVDILKMVEQNNLQLKAARSQTEADKSGNLTATNWTDPEVEFGYLWGGPASIGKRKDVSVSQSIDLATLGGQRKRLAKAQNLLEDYRYEVIRQSVLAQADKVLLALIYSNRKLDMQRERKEYAQIIMSCMQRRLDAGEGNILDLNQAKMNLTAEEAELARLESEHMALQEELNVLNGGQAVSVESAQFGEVVFPVNFDSWYSEVEAKIPALDVTRQKTAVAASQVAVVKAEGLPSLSVGYMGEFTRGERYQGATIGLSIPLWSNRQKVRQAKLAAQSVGEQAADVRLQYRSRLKALYLRAEGLHKTLDMYRQTQSSQKGFASLRRALEAGEISLTEYLVSIGTYNDFAGKVLQAEFEFQSVWADLHSVLL